MPAASIDSSVVVDASIALAWGLRDEEGGAAGEIFQRALARGAAAPSLWIWEVQSALHVAERRGRLMPEETFDLAAAFRSLPIEFVSPAPLGTDLRIAREHGLTPYDAAYLELALRRKLKLATLDADLARAAARIGVLADGL